MTNIVLETIKKRRTTRVYTQEQIKKEELEAILEAGLYAPSAHNQQSWHFTVVQNPELLQELDRDAKLSANEIGDDFTKGLANNPNYNIFYNAPTAIIVSGNRRSILPHVDCAAAAQNMLIAAESLEIGGCWNGFITLLFMGTKKEEYKEKLGIPETHEPYYAIVLGYKKNKDAPPPARQPDRVKYI